MKPNLKELSQRLDKVDHHLFALISQRMSLVRHVQEAKAAEGRGILRKRVEDERLDTVAEWAKGYNLSPSFARALEYLLILESCRVQLEHSEVPLHERHGDLPEELRANLLQLTEAVAPTYDDTYDDHFFATHSHRMLESLLVDKTLSTIEERGMALDLGCATGSYARRLSFSFARTIGIDVSPFMVSHAVASTRPRKASGLEFKNADLEEGIPVGDAEVGFIVMNLGTASEIREPRHLLHEVSRVLHVGGKAFLSFYNSDALVYRWQFIPWPLSLAAAMDPLNNSLDVHVKGITYRTYARATSIDEVRSLLPNDLEIVYWSTFPTVSSILPDEFFDRDPIRETIEDIDQRLSSEPYGTYLTVICQKQEAPKLI